MSGSATDTSIANMALGFLGKKQISSIDGTEIEAKACKQYIETAKNMMLEDSGWGFAERRVSLAVVAGVDMTGYDAYTYAYAYPADCLIAHRIYNSSSTAISDKIPFVLGTNPAADAVYIFCDTKDAVLVYMASTNSYTTMKSSTFQVAFAYLLAALAGGRLKVDNSRIEGMWTNYFAFNSKAQVKDSNERHEQPDMADAYIDAMK
jgi:hypothetical protein